MLFKDSRNENCPEISALSLWHQQFAALCHLLMLGIDKCFPAQSFQQVCGSGWKICPGCTGILVLQKSLPSCITGTQDVAAASGQGGGFRKALFAFRELEKLINSETLHELSWTQNPTFSAGILAEGFPWPPPGVPAGTGAPHFHLLLGVDFRLCLQLQTNLILSQMTFVLTSLG